MIIATLLLAMRPFFGYFRTVRELDLKQTRDATFVKFRLDDEADL